MVSPGEIVTLAGFNIGPLPLTLAAIDPSTGRFGRGDPAAGCSAIPRASGAAWLADLERAYDGALAAVSEPSCEAAPAETRAKIREILVRRGVEQRPDESLMEAFARALGLTPSELGTHLTRRASEDKTD